MKTLKTLSLIFNLIAIGLFVTAIILIVSEVNQSLGMAFNSLGSIFLLLGIYCSRKTRNEDK